MASSVPSMDEVESALEEGVEAASKHVSHPIKWFFFFVLVFTFLFAGPVNHVMGVREKPIAPQAQRINQRVHAGLPPAEIALQHRVISVACGAYHSLAVTDDARRLPAGDAVG